MKKTIIGILLIFALPLHALHVECVGKAVQLLNEGDTLLLFASRPELRIVGITGEVNILCVPDTTKIYKSTSISANSSPSMTHIDIEQGGYMLKAGDVREIFWVFDYDSLRPRVTDISADLQCNETQLTLSGTVPAITYRRLNGLSRTYARTCSISYRDAAWDDSNEAWADSMAVSEQDFKTSMTVGAPAVQTDFAIYDLLAQQLDLAADTLYSPVYEPIALKAHPITITTTRGQKGELSNEVNRPYDKGDILSMSAPLEVQFRANGLNAEYYQWRIYKGSSLLVKRADAEHRYTFSDPGSYRAVVDVSNTHCALDSVEFTISISESMLLVPNVFTPNGDGTNDEFRVAYRSLKEFHCWVYNRWGMLVYQWSDPAKGWDGTINGQPAAEGAYYYVIRALGTDAAPNAKYTIKPAYKRAIKKQSDSMVGVYQLSGAVNLLRGGK